MQGAEDESPLSTANSIAPSAPARVLLVVAAGGSNGCTNGNPAALFGSDLSSMRHAHVDCPNFPRMAELSSANV
jgi:hypothetical protein